MKMKKDNIEITNEIRDCIIAKSVEMDTIEKFLSGLTRVLGTTVAEYGARSDEEGVTMMKLLVENLTLFRDASREHIDELKREQLHWIHDTYPELDRFEFKLQVEGNSGQAFNVTIIDIFEGEEALH